MMNRTKRWIALFCCAVLAVFSACSSRDAGTDANDSKIRISVTFNAIKEFAEAVGGDRVAVTAIIPDGMEAHGFEPKAKDLASLGTADLFVYNGLGMEPWVEEALQSAGSDSLIVVDASKGADVIDNETGEEHEEEEHDHGKCDPHLWLSIFGAKAEAENIRDALKQADPEGSAEYDKNCNHFAMQLESLHNEYNEKLGSTGKKSFVTGHAAFGYLCRDFGLEQNSVSDIYAEGEPSAQQLIELVEYCRQNRVATVFAEEMASPDVSRTLADEVGARVETIYTMETSENGKTFVQRMDENLQKIYESLKA